MTAVIVPKIPVGVNVGNYYECWAHSNPFKVGDPEGFCEWADERNIHYQEIEYFSYENALPHDMIVVMKMDEGGWPDFFWNDEDGDEVPIDVFEEIKAFLAPDTVAILYQTDNSGWGIAVACKAGEQNIVFDLNDVRKRVTEQWGIRPWD